MNFLAQGGPVFLMSAASHKQKGGLVGAQNRATTEANERDKYCPQPSKFA